MAPASSAMLGSSAGTMGSTGGSFEIRLLREHGQLYADRAEGPCSVGQGAYGGSWTELQPREE